MSAVPGQLVDGRYEVVERVGTGGMADVFRADDRQLGRPVALKLLHPRFAEDAHFVERFRREASAAAGLSHPNVVGVYDRGEWEGRPYIAMEYMPGRTLKDLVDEQGQLPVPLAIELTVQVLRAARFAHRKGIIHRDLKPHNVMVDEEGRAKVTDFGIARAGASDMTQTGSLLGTAQYLAPEQAQGERVTPATDLYSVGVLLYELLTGRVPFEAESPVTVALKHVSEPPVPPSRLNPAVPPELDAVVLRALAKDPAARFADADAFIAALEGVRAGGPVSAGVVEEVVEAPPVDEPRRRWPWLVLAALALAGLVAAALLLTRDPERVRVPSVVGSSVEEASARLRAAGFAVDSDRQASRRPRGQVIRQAPRAGTRREEGSTVRLVVSAGPPSRAVPDLVGRPRADAERRLEDLGFTVRVHERASESVEVGRVVSIRPAPGTQLEVGEGVRLVVSTGPPPVAVPRVVGLPEAQARAALEGAGLVVGEVTPEESTEVDPGIVLRQGFEAGASVRPGTAVALVVATEPEPVEVPEVEGRTLAAARRALTARGLEVAVERIPVTDPALDGRVVEQDPAGGDQLEPGGSVTLTVGRFDEGAAEPDGGPDPGSEEGGQPEATEGTEGTEGTDPGAEPQP
ncbi:MAG: PASTA domain-containing protein [Actinomycetota bacterium]|nr:PASTA domain-containing protein [Actinomycetota bacterium]